MERVETGEADWSVLRAFMALVAGKANRDDLTELAAMRALAPKLRERAKAKLG